MFNRSFRHWTIRYIANRLQVMLYERLHPDSPWLCKDAVKILDSWLKPTDRGFEWGSGRSTIWFAMRVSHLISVEHDPKWAEIMKKKLHDLNLSNRVDYHFLPDGVKGESNCNYVNLIRDVTPNSLDFCLIDGQCRNQCAFTCLDKLKQGGILIFDNIEEYIPRDQKSYSPHSRGTEDGFASKAWEEWAKIISNWRCIWITNGVWDTALLIKDHQ
jgi:hypothetical protein